MEDNWISKELITVAYDPDWCNPANAVSNADTTRDELLNITSDGGERG